MVPLYSGCGSDGADRPATYAVSGPVTLDSKPLAGVAIQFVPIDTNGRSATGKSNADGNYSLFTFEDGDGAIPGEYKVVVISPGSSSDAKVPEKGGGSQPVSAGPKLPDKYRSPNMTDIKVTVTDSDNTIPIELKSGG